MIAQRYDQMVSGVSQVLWREEYENIATAISKQSRAAGKLTIKRMSTGTNSIQIRSYLKEYELKNGFVPDMLVVDYLDLMGSNNSMYSENVSEKDKQTTEQLRDVCFDYNMYLATASQQNRTAIDAPVASQSHIAGGLTKINTVDIAVSILFSTVMKSSGDMGFTFTKTRSSDGVGKTCMSTWDAKYLRIRPSTKPVSEDPIQSKYINNTDSNSTTTLADLMSKHKQPRIK